MNELKTAKEKINKIKKKDYNLPPISQIREYVLERYEIRFNEIAHEFEYRHSGTAEPYEKLNEDDLLIEILESGFKISMQLLISLLRSKYIVRYNPIQRYFHQLGEWKPQYDDEGTLLNDHIGQLAAYVRTTDDERFRHHFRKHLVRMVACSLGISYNKQALILSGPQNDGKSTFLRFLCPASLADYIKENIEPEHKDSIIALCQNFMINLDELSSFSRKDINVIKSLFSLDRVKVRLQYGRKDENLKRVANFVGSTNKDEFLTDETGSVRWLVFEIEGINFAYSQKIDMDKVYAQAYTLLMAGFEYRLSKTEIEENNQINMRYAINFPELELIQKYYQPSDRIEGEFMTATDILEELSSLSKIKLTPQMVGKALKMEGYEKISQRKNANCAVKGYYVKKIASGQSSNESPVF